MYRISTDTFFVTNNILLRFAFSSWTLIWNYENTQKGGWLKLLDFGLNHGFIICFLVLFNVLNCLQMFSSSWFDENMLKIALKLLKIILSKSDI